MWRLLVVVAGCSFSAGPVVGYGQRGIVLGGEVGGGVYGFEATGGYTTGTRYARLDDTAQGGSRWFDASDGQRS